MRDEPPGQEKLFVRHRHRTDTNSHTDTLSDAPVVPSRCPNVQLPKESAHVGVGEGLSME